MRIFSSVAFFLCAISAPLFAQQTELAIKTTLCEIKRDPMAFNKKLVEVSGYATHGFEDSMFDDPTCFEGHGRLGIWMEYGGTSSVNTMFCCGFSPSNKKKQLVVQDVEVPLVQDKLFDRFDTLLHSKPREDISIRATVRGYVFVSPKKGGS